MRQEEETLKCLCALYEFPLVEKFKIVSNDHGRTQKKRFFGFRRKILFLVKFAPKN